MNPQRWFEIAKEALTLTESDPELDTSQLEFMTLIQLDTEVQTFSTSKKEVEVHNSSLFGQAWHCLINILTNELRLEAWNSLTIKSHSKAVVLYSLGFDIFLIIASEAVVDTLDVMKVILKYIFQLGYREKYETVGLVSAEGYPVWVNSIEEMDEFLFAISITSLLTLVERIDMEVAAGGIDACILQGTENLLLNVTFNPSQDLALAVTQHGLDPNDIKLDSELHSLYQKITDPVIYSALVPEITDQDRERMLEEIRQAFEGETTEEEIQTLSVFDTEMLLSLENEIKTVAKKYGAKEISIGYLRKRMKLPAEVLSMALQYLIGEGSIVGRIGTERKTGSEVLVLDLISDINDDERQALNSVQMQIKDLFIPINTYLSQLPEIQPPKEVVQEFTEALGEFQIMLTLSDTDPLYLLTNDLRIVSGQLENSAKSLFFVNTQLTETSQDDVLREELVRRRKGLEERISEQQLSIIGKAKKFHEDLLNSYLLLSRLLPSPYEFKSSESKGKVIIKFKCSALQCETTIQIEDDPITWIKMSFFATILGIQDEFPEESPPLVINLKDPLEDYYNRLYELATETEKGLVRESEYYLFLENLDELLMPNAQRDDAISILKQSNIEPSVDDFYSLFAQCNSCNKWYCSNHMAATTKCKYC